MSRRITVLVVHHEPALYRRLRRMFRRQREIRLLDPFQPDHELTTNVRKQRPRVLFLDSRFLRRDVYQLLANIRRRSPATNVVMLGPRYTQAEELQAARAGARGYLGGNTTPAVFRKTIHAVAAGETWIRRKTASRMLDEFTRLAPLP